MELTTDRCFIRNMKMTDTDDLYQVYSDERVMMYMEPVFDMQRTKEFIQVAGLCEPPLVYAIVWKITGRVIGHVIFHSYERNDYEIGWILNKDYWGMGIADEVTKALIMHDAWELKVVSLNVIQSKLSVKRLQLRMDLYMRAKREILNGID